MAKILIVEDEEGFRRQLELGLSTLGHEIRCASSGREGVDVGARFCPDLLVTDWMLKDDIHGLRVIQVLRSILTHLKAILITGFASAELRENADSHGIVAFIEKPFRLEAIRGAVENALATPCQVRQRAPLAVVEIAAEGDIRHANDAALDLFDETDAGRGVRNFLKLFAAGAEPNLDEALDRWKVASPAADHRLAWHLRTQELDENGSRLVILRRGDGPQYVGLPVIEMLLGCISPQRTQWPFDGRVVIVEGDATARKWLITMIENAGGGCYAVETVEQAIRLLGNDDGLQFAVLDRHTAGADLTAAIEQMHAIRPDVVLVGSSPDDRREEFARLGVTLFLQRPWRVHDLINLLTGRIGNCHVCGIQLPLRRPRMDEQSTRWACSNCGAVYAGVLDEDASFDMLLHIRRSDDTQGT
jgi:CheY-like chemotaxis protein